MEENEVLGTTGTYRRPDGGIEKLIKFAGEPAKIACDAQCDKAWGIHNRPRVVLSPTDDNDYYFLADSELGIAPDDPGTDEGGHKKPTEIAQRLNKWCCRECERCEMSRMGKSAGELTLERYHFTIRRYNSSRRQADYEAALARGETPP